MKLFFTLDYLVLAVLSFSAANQPAFSEQRTDECRRGSNQSNIVSPREEGEARL
jgi:hypothetical protein